MSLSLAAALLLVAAPLASAQPSLSAKPEQVAKLITTLQSAAPQKEKADACRELARIGTREAVPALAALLGDEQLSHMARYALETIPDSAADAALRNALGNLHGRPLVGVIGSLGVRRDTRAVKPLAALLQDADPDVAQAAARALGQIGSEAAARALQQALPMVIYENQPAFCEGLLRSAESLAAQGRHRQARAVYDQLRALPVLAHQVRTAAWRGAILMRGKAGLPLLLTAIHSDDFSLFAAAMRISQELPGTAVTRALSAALPNLPVEKQIVLIPTLANRADAAALPALVAAARNSEPPVRLAAIRALPQFGSPAVVPVLVELLGQADRERAQAAQEGLAGLSCKEADAAVMELLASNDAARRVTAIELIARRRMTSALPGLFHLAADPDAKVRLAALKKLGELAGPGDLPGLLDLLDRATDAEDLETTEQALSAVSVKAPRPDDCASKLASRLQQAGPPQRCALLRALAAVGGPTALRSVRAAVGDSNADIHSAAIHALSGWTTPDAAPELLALARAAANPTDKALCLRGYLRLAAQSELAAEKRLAMCRNAAGLLEGPEEKRLLLAALGALPTPEALALIEPYLDDPALRQEASAAAVAGAERILHGKDAANCASSLVQPLEKIAAAANADLAKRARDLLQQARTKAGEK